MGKSQTINVIMLSEEIKAGKKRIFDAMNKREMAQNIIKAKSEGLKLVSAYAQTKTGCKMIKSDNIYEEVDITNIRLPDLIECPACRSEKCGICNFTGYTTKAWLNGFKPWQLEYKSNRTFYKKIS
jgi:hypothetical protein